MRSEIVPTPGGPYTRGDICGAPRPSPAPAAQAPAADVPSAQARGASGKPPAVDPKLPMVNGPPVSTEPLRTNKPDAAPKPPVVQDVTSDPRTVKYYEDRFSVLPQAQADKEVAAARNAKGLKPQQVVSMLEAYHKRYGVHAPGVSEVADPAAAPVVPPATTPAVPPSTAQVPVSPKVGGAAGVPPSGARVVEPRIVSPEQLREQDRKEEDQNLQRIAALDSRARLDLAQKEAERNRLGTSPDKKQNSIANDLFLQGKVASPNYADLRDPTHRKLVDDIYEAPALADQLRKDADEIRKQHMADLAEERLQRQQKLDLVGQVTSEQHAVSNKLFLDPDPAKRVKERHYALMDAEDQEKVNKEIRDPKLRKEHLDALKVAQPMMDELAMLENTQYLTRQIIPLLKRANIGLGGRVTNFSNAAWNLSPTYRAGYLAKAEEQLKKEGLGPGLDRALEEARATAMVEGTDPGLMSSLYYTAGTSRLETLVALLMYSHAMAQKRIGAGTARGITTEDMKEARKLFDPSDFFATPDKMYEKLVTLQQTIQRGRERKENEVRMRHIDPKTGNLILKSYYQEGETAPTCRDVRGPGEPGRARAAWAATQEGVARGCTDGPGNREGLGRGSAERGS